MRTKRICGIGLAAAVAGQMILPQLPALTAAAAVMKTCSLEEFSGEVLAVTQGDAAQSFFDEIVYDSDAGTLSADGSSPDARCGDLQVRDGELMLRTDRAEWEPFADAAADWGYETSAEGSLMTITNEFQTARLIVKAEGSIDLHGAESAAEGYRSLHILQYADSAAAYSAYQAYLADPAVEYVQPSHRISLDAQALAEAQAYAEADAKADAKADAAAESSYNSWGVPLIGTEDFIAKYLDADVLPEVVVAVLDTGINRSPKLFEGRILEDGINISDSGDDSVADDLYHGTHVTGTICEMTPNNVKILPVKVFDENGNASDEQIYLGLMYALEKHADIVNMSFGGLGVSPLEIEAMSVADENGMICCAASGNNGDDAGFYYPGSIASCITVGAVTEELEKASFSNYGSSLDVVAPGYGVVSYVLGDNEQREAKNGTSMATPHVSACCALLRSYDKEMTPRRAEALLRLNAKDIGVTGFDVDFGWGFVNMADFCWDDGICPSPVFSVQSGNYGKPVTVAMSVDLEDAQIWYTTDGTIPSPENGIRYEAPVTVSESTRFYAVAVREGWISSAPAEAVYTINGEDVQNAYTVKDGVLISYRGIRKKVYVPETVNGEKLTAVAAEAFAGNHFTEEIQLPVSVRKIGDSAFAECSLLERFYAPGAEEIGTEAFADSQLLREVNLADAVRSVGDAAFRGCESLRDISLRGLLSVPAQCFAGCTMLARAELPDVTEIGEKAFYQCESLTSPVLHWQQVTAIGTQAFAECTAWSGNLRLPALETLGTGVFSGDTMLRRVMLPERITLLPAETFYGCSGIRQLSLPGITKIGRGALALQTGRLAVPTGLNYEKITSVGAGAFEGFLIGNGYDTVVFSSLKKLAVGAFAGAQAGGLSFPEITAVPRDVFTDARIDCVILEQAETIGARTLTGCAAVRLTEKLQSVISNSFAEDAWIVAESELPALAKVKTLHFCNEPLVMRRSGTTELRQHEPGALRVLACGNGLTYQWYLVSGEELTPVSGADQPVLYPDSSEAGTFVYRCVMTDAQGKTEQTDMTVKVKAADAPDALEPGVLYETDGSAVQFCQIQVPETGVFRIVSAGSTAAEGELCDAAGQPVAALACSMTGGEMLEAALDAGQTYYLRTEKMWNGNYALYLSGSAVSETDLSGCELKVTVQKTCIYGSGYEPEVVVRKPDGTKLKKDRDYILRFTKHNQLIRISVFGIGACCGYAETTVTVYEKIPEDTPVPVQIGYEKEEAVYVFVPKTGGVYRFYANCAAGYAEEQLAYNCTGRYAGGSQYVNIRTRCWVADSPSHSGTVYAFNDYSTVTRDYFNASVMLHAGQAYYFVCSGSSGAVYDLVITAEDYDIREAEISGTFLATYDPESNYRPRIRVTLGDRQLTEGVDYQRIDRFNDLPGKATVTVVGMGLYYGRISREYEITYAEPEQSDTMLELDTPVTVTCSDRRVETLWFTVDGGKTVNDTLRYRILNSRISGGAMNYTLYRYDDVFDMCAMMLPMKGEQNDYQLRNGTYVLAVSREYPEQASKADFSVLIPHSITDAVVTVTNQPYTGDTVPLPVKVHAADGTELLLNRDFRIFYKESNIMFGTVGFSIQATERTFGYQEGSFDIYVDLPEDAPVLETGSHTVSVTKQDRLAVYRVMPETDTEYVLCTSDVADIVLRVFSPEAEMLEQDYGAGPKSVKFTVPAGETRYVMVKFNGTAREGTINFRLETSLRMLAACTVTAERQIWTGEPIKPDVKFTDGDYELVEGRDYRLRYTADDVNIGTATFNYTGMGDYFGNCDVELDIVPENLFKADFFDPQPLALDETYSVNKNDRQYAVFSYTSGIDTELRASFFDAMCKLTVQCYDNSGEFIQSIFFKPHEVMQVPVKAGESVYFVVSATNISSRNQTFNILLHDNGGEHMRTVSDAEGGISYRISETNDYAEAYEVIPDTHASHLTLLPEIEGVPVSHVPKALFAGLPKDTVVMGYAGCAAADYADSYGFIYQQAPAEGQEPVQGDLNGDGRCSAADMTIFSAMLAEHPGLNPALFPFGAADLNEDGVLNLTDLRMLQRMLAA